MNAPTHESFRRHHDTATTARESGNYVVAERAIEALQDLVYGLLAERPDFIASRFHYLAGQRHAALDPIRFNSFVARGNAAISAGATDQLRSISSELASLLPCARAPTADIGSLAGVRR